MGAVMGAVWSAFDPYLLIDKVSNGSEDVKEAAAKKISDAASKSDDKRKKLADAGAVPVLLKMAKTGSARGKEYAAAALGHLALLQENKELIAREGAIPVVVKLLAEEENPGVQGAAVTALSSLASKSRENQDKIAKLGAIQPMVKLTRSGYPQVREWAAAAVGNVALQHEGNQTLAADAGAIESFVALLKASESAPLPLPAPAVAFSLASCRRRAPGPNAAGVAAVRAEQERLRAAEGSSAEKSTDGTGSEADASAANADDSTSTLATTTDDTAMPARLTCTAKGKEWVARAVCSLAFNHNANRTKIIESGGVEPLAKLVMEGSREAQLEGVKALLNIVSATAEGKSRCGEAGCIPALVQITDEGKKLSDRELAAGLLGNLASGCPENQAKIVKAGGVQHIAGLLQIGTTQGKLWAAVAIANLAEGTHEIKTRIGKEHAIRPLVWLAEEGSPQQRSWASKALASLGKDHEENQKLIKLHGGVLPKQDLAATGMRLRSMEEMHPAASERARDLREVAEALAAEKASEEEEEASAPAATADDAAGEEPGAAESGKE